MTTPSGGGLRARSQDFIHTKAKVSVNERRGGRGCPLFQRYLYSAGQEELQVRSPADTINTFAETQGLRKTSHEGKNCVFIAKLCAFRRGKSQDYS